MADDRYCIFGGRCVHYSHSAYTVADSGRCDPYTNTHSAQYSCIMPMYNCLPVMCVAFFYFIFIIIFLRPPVCNHYNCGYFLVCLCLCVSVASISFIFFFCCWSVQMTDFDLLSAIHIMKTAYIYSIGVSVCLFKRIYIPSHIIAIASSRHIHYTATMSTEHMNSCTGK